MERYFSTGQSPQRAVAPTEEEEEEKVFTALPHSPFCVETAFYNGLLKKRYKGG
jgi:hypothetical protein